MSGAEYLFKNIDKSGIVKAIKYDNLFTELNYTCRHCGDVRFSYTGYLACVNCNTQSTPPNNALVSIHNGSGAFPLHEFDGQRFVLV